MKKYSSNPKTLSMTLTDSIFREIMVSDSPHAEVQCPVGTSKNAPSLTVTAGGHISLRTYLAELWAFRELLSFLLWRDITIRYRRTVIGIAWVIFQPALQALILWWLFGQRFLGDTIDDQYPLQVLGGTILWLYGTNSILSSIHHLSSSGQLITKVYFPRALLVISPCLMHLLDLGIAMVVLLVSAIYLHSLHWTLIFFPISCLGLLISILGPCLVLGILASRYRDIKHVAPYFLQLWMFATPAIYMPSAWHHSYINTLLCSLNPLQCWVQMLAHNIRGQLPPWQYILTGFISSALIAVISLRIFTRLEHNLADYF